MKIARALVMVMLQCVAGAAALRAQTPVATIPIGENPMAIGFNVTTNKIYAVGGYGHVLVEIDGASFESTTIPLEDPGDDQATAQIAVNPITNKIYVINVIQDHVTVIDGRTHAVSFVPTGHHPYKIALNIVTNKLYVANYDSASVTVVDCARLKTKQVTVGQSPSSVAVNPVTNTIYVGNEHGNSVSVIDGNSNRVTNVAVGQYPVDVAVDVLMNRVYVANLLDHTLSQINGRTNRVVATTALTGMYPQDVAVNSLTGRIYVGFQVPGHVVVLDGHTGVQSVVTTGIGHLELVIDTLRDRVYSPGLWLNVLGTVKGKTLTSTTVPSTGNYPYRVAVNALRNMIYVANEDSHDITIYSGEPGTPLQNSLAGLVP